MIIIDSFFKFRCKQLKKLNALLAISLCSLATLWTSSCVFAGNVFPGDGGVTYGDLQSEPDVYYPQTRPVLDPSNNKILPAPGPRNPQVFQQQDPQPTTAE